jgi:hypothetical protein
LCAAFYQAGWSAVDTAAILQEFFGSDSTNGMYLLADTQISGDPSRFLSQWRRLMEHAELATVGVATLENSRLPNYSLPWGLSPWSEKVSVKYLGQAATSVWIAPRLPRSSPRFS